jgi:dipeptidyl-peptidase-4
MKKYFILLYIIIFIPFVYPQSNEITLEDIFLNGKYRAQSLDDFKHLKDGEHFAMLDTSQNIIRIDYATGNNTETILSNEKLLKLIEKPDISIDDFQFSDDENLILISTETERLFRHSSVSNYYIYDIQKKSLTALSVNGKQRLATFSPDNKKIAFVRDNNIFIKDLIDNQEIQITKDGKRNKIINGAPDWVYEEEFALSKAFDWSSDGSELAYMRFDESNVKEFDLTFYGDLYPELFKYKYPKAGEDNSIVSVWIYDLNSQKSVKVDVGSNPDQYIPRIKWSKKPHILSITRLNRLQNMVEVILVSTNTGQTYTIITDKDDYYINENFDLTFIKDDKFLRFYKSDEGFMHLHSYNYLGSLSTQVTKGKFEINRLDGVDEKDKTVYYESNEPGATERALYSVSLVGTGKKLISPASGYTIANFSKNFKYYISYHSDANTPSVISVNSNDGKILRVLKDNKKLNDYISNKGFVKKEFFKFTTSKGFELNGWMMKPENISAGTKCPVLMNVYGGPGSQIVLDAWGGQDFVWYQMLCKKGYVIACVDGRSTGGRGEEFQKCNYMHLGTVEVEDQIEAAKYFASLNFVDKDRIGIWGWSYGGLMTTLCMTVGADYFKTGVAVAPVTDWRYYDNIYTERYMRTPKENPEGYKNGSPITYADKLKGNLLIVHGSTDDNVHMQNTMDFVNALIKANKQFEMQIYPNRNHNISGGNTRYHLFKRITEYILKNL